MRIAMRIGGRYTVEELKWDPAIPDDVVADIVAKQVQRSTLKMLADLADPHAVPQPFDPLLE